MSSSEARRATLNPDFGPLAESYDRLRPPDRNWRELLHRLVIAGDLAGRRVLDVGCGTGGMALALAELGSRVWGVDPADEMVAVARARVGRAVGLKLGRAEALPFKDGWFERAVLRLVVHLVERRRALPELARVLGPTGRVAIATFDRPHFHGFWLTRFFPTIERIDAARFPDPESLAGELEATGFADARVERLVQHDSLSRGEALDRIRGRYISTLQLVSEDELAEGTARAEDGLPELVEVELRWAIVSAVRP
jgi:ubiquinone/menaquinone biosynthesis C-methylase UbiE